MSSGADNGSPSRPGEASWKSLARARIAYLEDDIRLSNQAGPRDQDAELALSAAENAIERANKALGVRGGFGVGLRNWWTGWDKEQAWLALHAAEAQLALAEPDDAVRAELSSLQAKIRSRLRASDPQRAAWTEALEAARTSQGKVDRYLVRQIKETLHAITDGGHARTRSFRNILVAMCGVLAVAAVLLAIPAVSDWVPLDLAEATEASTDADAEEGADAAAGSEEPAEQPADEEGADDEAEDEAEASDSGVDSVWQIELLGALGGLLAALASIQRFRGLRSPYNLAFVQALLKVPAGALTALVGIVLMQSDILFLEAQAGTALAAYAIFFGIAQDVVTRLVDQKAREVTEAAEGSSETPAGA